MATAAGVLLALNPRLGLATLATWIIIASFSATRRWPRWSRPRFAPFYQVLIWGAEPAIAVIVPMSLLLVWRHAANISKLLAGTESKLFAKAEPKRPEPKHHKRAFFFH